MKFNSEDELQAFVSATLAAMDIPNEREVWTHDKKGRADIVTGELLIEIKPTLTRSSLFQAAGQLYTYSPSFPNRDCVIAGCTPKGADALKSAQTAAASLKQQGIQIWFVDQIESFQSAYEQYRGIAQQPAQPISEDFGYFPIERWKNTVPSFLDNPIFWIVGFILLIAAQCSQVPEQQLTVNETNQSTGTIVEPSVRIVSIPDNKELNIRGDESDVVGVLSDGDRVSLLSDEDTTGYVKVRRVDGLEGWVFAEYLR